MRRGRHRRPVVEERGLLLRGRRDLLRLERRRHRRHPRHDRAHRVPLRPRRDVPVADALLPDRPQGRRLRHHRLLRRRPPPRDPRRLRRTRAHGSVEWHPGHRRLRHEPHVGRVIRGSSPPGAARTTRIATTTCGARPSRSRARRTSSSPTRRTASGNATPRRTSGTCTTSTSTNPISTSRIPKCRRRSHAHSASGSSSESPASGSTPSRSCSRRTPCREARTCSTPCNTSATSGISSPAASETPSCSARSTLPYKDQMAFFGGPDGDGLNMQFDFIGMQNIYLRWPAATPARSPRP